MSDDSHVQSPLRIVVMATGPFAAPTFEALYDTRHKVVALVTQPLRRARGARKAAPNALRAIAEARSTPILDPDSVNLPGAAAALSELRPDLFFVADYGQILAADTLSVANYGGLNLHASLLPKYRGAAPINWAIYHGETETGVTVIHMTPKIDAGPCVAQAKVAIEPDETAEDLEIRLAKLGAPLVCEVIDQLQAGRTTAIPQDPQLATKAPRLKKTDGLIRWRRTAPQVRDQIRGFWPWPKCYSYWMRPRGEALRLIVGKATARGNVASAAPGVVVQASDGQLIVATGEGAVSLEEIQPSGKRMLSAAEFLRGYPVAVGDTFGEA